MTTTPPAAGPLPGVWLTAVEAEALELITAGLPDKVIARRIGRHWKNVYRIRQRLARRLGRPELQPASRAVWNDQLDAELVRMLPTHGYRAIARVLGMTGDAVGYRVRRLGLRPRLGVDRPKTVSQRTPEAEADLIRLFPVKGYEGTARELGLSPNGSIRKWVRALRREGRLGPVPQPIKPWTPEKVERVIREYPGCRPKQLAAELGVPVKSLFKKAARLGVKWGTAGPQEPGAAATGVRGATAGTTWTAEMDAELAGLFGAVPVSELAERFGCCKATIRSRAIRNGLYTPAPYEGRFRWTPERNALLADLYPTTPRQRIADLLGCTKTAVIVRAGKLGLRQKQPPWPAEAVMRLVKEWGTRPPAEIAAEIGRTTVAVVKKAEYLGLKSASSELTRLYPRPARPRTGGGGYRHAAGHTRQHKDALSAAHIARQFDHYGAFTAENGWPGVMHPWQVAALNYLCRVGPADTDTIAAAVGLSDRPAQWRFKVRLLGRDIHVLDELVAGGYLTALPAGPGPKVYLPTLHTVALREGWTP